MATLLPFGLQFAIHTCMDVMAVTTWMFISQCKGSLTHPRCGTPADLLQELIVITPGRILICCFPAQP